MDNFYLYLAIVTLILWVLTAIEAKLGTRTIEHLNKIKPYDNPDQPRVSIVIPALNEERHIRQALTSILNQDYENFEVIVINDRSTDRTGEILEAMSEEYSRLTVYNLTELPHGWLGKNHALYYGTQKSDGEYILFTDADVFMKPSTISRAVAFMHENNIDHLAVSPGSIMKGTLLQMFAVAFIFFFGLYTKPWKVRDPKSKKHIGIGAFNMVRRDAYEKAGTHKKIALRPDDDIKLGKIIKDNGLRQEVLFGKEMISVEWYGSLKDTIDGLMKNSFSIVEYSVFMVVFYSVLQLIFNVWPYIAVFIIEGPARYINLVIIHIIIFLQMSSAKNNNLDKRAAIGYPLAVLILNYISWRAMFLTLKNKGIYWRGTYYSLKVLKSNKV
jgi:glycosyltransferase involved in cell wall biosynthesis